MTHRPLLLWGRIWTGGNAKTFIGTVSLDRTGRITSVRPDPETDADARRDAPEAGRPAEAEVLGGASAWIGPGIVDAHVHQSFTDRPDVLGPGLVGVRDLGAPLADALRWQRSGGVAISGPVLTATGGYPSQSWGRNGFARGVDNSDEACDAVRELAAVGVDVVKVALEPGPGWPVPAPDTLQALVDCAHECGLAVVAHALRLDMVRRALDAGVDELAHIPTERLPAADVERIAAAGTSVVSTLQTFFADGDGRAGVTLRYGTDLGNAGTTPGVDPRELDRLADAGLGRHGALLAATLHSAAAPGVRGRTGLLQEGTPANLVVLTTDPELEPAAWRCPLATFVGGTQV